MENKNIKKKKKRVKDPYMKNPIYKYILYIILAILVIFLSFKVIDFYSDVIEDTGARAGNS